VSIPLKTIRQIETRKTDLTATTLAVAGAGMAAMLVVVGVSWDNAFGR
jgi:hypothetical protein